MFQDRTLNAAYRKMTRAMCPHIGKIAFHGGANFDFKEDKYDYVGERKGGIHFVQPNKRNIIWFPRNPPVIEQKGVLGDKRFVGEAREHFAYYQTVQNDTDRDITGAEVHYTTFTESTLTDEHESMLGWNWSIAIEAQAGGGEASGGSYVKVTGTTGMEGSETNRHGSTTKQGDEAGLKLPIDIPAHESVDVDQLVSIQDAEQIEERMLICNVSGQVVGYKHLRRHGNPKHWLRSNKDWRKWHGRSRIIFEFNSLSDLYEILTGGHRDYPEQRKNLLDRSGTIREAWEYLDKEDNRTIKYTVTRKIEDAFHGQCRVSDN